MLKGDDYLEGEEDMAPALVSYEVGEVVCFEVEGRRGVQRGTIVSGPVPESIDGKPLPLHDGTMLRVKLLGSDSPVDITVGDVLVSATLEAQASRISSAAVAARIAKETLRIAELSDQKKETTERRNRKAIIKTMLAEELPVSKGEVEGLDELREAIESDDMVKALSSGETIDITPLDVTTPAFDLEAFLAQQELSDIHVNLGAALTERAADKAKRLEKKNAAKKRKT